MYGALGDLIWQTCTDTHTYTITPHHITNIYTSHTHTHTHTHIYTQREIHIYYIHIHKYTHITYIHTPLICASELRNFKKF